MGHITFILIDEIEKRTKIDYNVCAFVASLSRNPATINDFNNIYQKLAGETFYSEGNRPIVPEELSFETLRKVFGMPRDTDAEVLGHWKKTSFYEDKNYRSCAPNTKTEKDIPELTQDIIDEWKQEDPEAEEFPTANDYRKFLCKDGIVVADLRTKELRYISPGAFEIPRISPTELDVEFGFKVVPYILPDEWKIIEE